jgi:hypothetical protein
MRIVCRLAIGELVLSFSGLHRFRFLILLRKNAGPVILMVNDCAIIPATVVQK